MSCDNNKPLFSFHLSSIDEPAFQVLREAACLLTRSYLGQTFDGSIDQIMLLEKNISCWDIWYSNAILRTKPELLTDDMKAKAPDTLSAWVTLLRADARCVAFGLRPINEASETLMNVDDGIPSSSSFKRKKTDSVSNINIK